jgi:hypothetical protein
VGYYLSLSDDDKKTLIDTNVKKYPWSKDIKTDVWIERLNALKKEWKSNRNPLTHAGIERISTLSQAQDAASSIIREIKVSIELFILISFSHYTNGLMNIRQRRPMLLNNS